MKLALLFMLLFSLSSKTLEAKLVIGSKRFTENYILAEIVSQIIEAQRPDLNLQRKFGLGGTGITYGALAEGEIALYPEYTGTIVQSILRKSGNLSLDQLNRELEEQGLMVSPSLGFNNTYGLAVQKEFAERHQLHTVSDLFQTPEVRLGLSHEFIKRKDGLSGLQQHYQKEFHIVQAMEHSLSYEALEKGLIDAVVVYSTDAKIRQYDLVVLHDDLSYFPRYESVLLLERSFPTLYPRLWQAFQVHLFGKIDESRMIELNALAEIEGESFAAIASRFLDREITPTKSLLKRLTPLALQHLKLVGVSLLFSVLIGIPLGYLATTHQGLGQLVLLSTGLLQTIPSLALLCFLIPFVGIGEFPAFVALFLYGLLPIVRNTHTGLNQIPSSHLETAKLMGMSRWQCLTKVQLPEASATILSGVQTSAVINVGTATLAAFIGAGGLGTLIVTGLALNNNDLILEGAVPAAFLALGLHFVFELLERLLISPGLRL